MQPTWRVQGLLPEGVCTPRLYGWAIPPMSLSSYRHHGHRQQLDGIGAHSEAQVLEAEDFIHSAPPTQLETPKSLFFFARSKTAAAEICHLKRHDSKIAVRRIPPVLPQEEPEDGQAQKPGNVRHAREGRSPRARRAVLQTALSWRLGQAASETRRKGRYFPAFVHWSTQSFTVSYHRRPF